MDNELSVEELEEKMASKLRELGMPEEDIKYWIEHPEEMVDCLYEARERKRREK